MGKRERESAPHVTYAHQKVSKETACNMSYNPLEDGPWEMEGQRQRAVFSKTQNQSQKALRGKASMM